MYVSETSLLVRQSNPLYKIVEARIRQDFQRHSSPQTRIFGQKHFTHSAFANLRDDAVMRQVVLTDIFLSMI
jgi:hypothetical protein